MELIERYIYAVSNKLPESQREEIEKEVRALIEDMMEAYSHEFSETDRVKKVLEELGNPSILADNYRGVKRYLIGPKNYEKYIFILKIVLIALSIGISVSTLVQGLFISQEDFSTVLGDYISSLFTGVLQGFAWVTIIFAVIEFKGVRINKEEKDEWDIKDLPKIPSKKAMFKKHDFIISIVFISLFTILVVFFPELMAIYTSGTEGYHIIPVFDLSVWENYKYWVFIIFIIGILREVIKMVFGRWCVQFSIYYIILTIISMIVTIIIFTNPQIWNPNFSVDVAQYMNINIENTISTKAITNAFVKIVIFVTIIEIVVAVIKGFKYDNGHHFSKTFQINK